MRAHALLLPVLAFAFHAATAQAAFITATLGVTNPVSLISYTVSFNTPYADGPHTFASLDYTLTVSDSGRDGASVTGTVTGLVDNVTAASLTLNCAVPAFEGFQGQKICSGSTSVPFAAPANATMYLVFDFELAGEGDTASLTSLFKLTDTTVPEPSTGLLGAAGIAALALLRRRRAA